MLTPSSNIKATPHVMHKIVLKVSFLRESLKPDPLALDLLNATPKLYAMSRRHAVTQYKHVNPLMACVFPFSCVRLMKGRFSQRHRRTDSQ